MTRAKIREVVLRLFEATRETPGTRYEPERFLAYLTEPPAPTGRRRTDTGAAVRRFNRFIDSLQLELGVCFNNKERDEGLGLDQLVAAIEKKLGNPGAQRRLAEKRLEQSRGALVNEPVKFGLAALCLVFIPLRAGGLVVRTLLVLLWLAIVVGTIVLVVREYRYAQRLAARIASRRVE